MTGLRGASVVTSGGGRGTRKEDGAAGPGRGKVESVVSGSQTKKVSPRGGAFACVEYD